MWKAAQSKSGKANVINEETHIDVTEEEHDDNLNEEAPLFADVVGAISTL